MLNRAVFLILLSVGLMGQAKFAPFQATTTPPNSTLGMNTNFFGPDIPLLNAIKYGQFLDTKAGGSGTSETTGLLQNAIDANGYPTSFSISGTFTGCVSSVTGSCSGSGTIVNITALGSGAKPWYGGVISGAGITGGTVLTSASGVGTASITGSLLNVTAVNSGVFGPGMIISDASNGQQHGTITSNGSGTGGTGTYNLSPTPDVGSKTLNATQIPSTIGTYISSTSNSTGSETITENNKFTSVQIDTLLGYGGITPSSGKVYQSGTWVFAYDGGDGTTAFTFSDDFSGMAKCSGVGRYISTSVSGIGGTNLAETVLGSPTPTNWRLIYSPGSSCTGCPSSCTIGTNEALFNAGEVFSPDFIDRMKSFKLIRMMNWQNIIATAMNDWNFRRIPTWIFYDDSPSIALKYNGPAGTIVFDGPPIELQVALCNKVGADCWFNIPPLADDTYITNMATLVHNGTTDSSGHVWSGLSSSLKAYVEFGNEFWNSVFCAPPGGSFTEYCQWVISDLDISFYPQNGPGLANKPFDQEKDYQALQSVRSANMWRTAWGADSGRIIGVYGGAGFDSSPGGTVQSSVIWGLATTDPGPNNIGPTYYTGTKQSNLNALAIAPYIGNGGCPGSDLNSFFVQANIDETAAVAEMTANNSAYGPFPIIIYESGFQYTGGSALCISAMRDARAGAMYADFYTRLRAAGNGGIMTHFDSIGPWNSSGFYQALESIVETTSPRYDALKNFRN